MPGEGGGCVALREVWPHCPLEPMEARTVVI